MQHRVRGTFGVAFVIATLASASACGSKQDGSETRPSANGGIGNAGAESGGVAGSSGRTPGGAGSLQGGHAGMSGATSGLAGASVGGTVASEAGAAGADGAVTSTAGMNAAGVASGGMASGGMASGGTNSGGSSTGGSGTYYTAGADWGGASGVDNAAIPTVDESALPEPVAKAGFVEIEPVSYSTQLSSLPGAGTSTRTRLFYNLLPADSDAKSKPVFVVFNGGPGAASSILRSYGTGRETLDGAHPDEPPVQNAASLTALANLLYIDAREAGYSYSLADDPANDAERAAGLDHQSFNEALDAADFVRVVLRVLEAEVALRNNPVVIVGESYGGVRTPLMLFYLQYPALLRQSSSIYTDPALADEVYAHASHVFLTSDERALTAEVLAGQFGWQFLLEPVVAGSFQFAAAAQMRADLRAALALEFGLSASEIAERCEDDASRTLAECDAIHAAADRVSVDPLDLEAFTAVSPSAVAQFAAAERGGAFRFATVPSEADPDSLGLGALPAWDHYYLPYANGPTDGAYTDLQTQPAYAAVFLISLEHTHTLITNGYYDTNVIGASIVPALREYMSRNPQSGLTEVAYEGSNPDAPSAQIRVRFDGGLWSRAGTAHIRFSSFPKSGHFVSVNEPERLFAVMADFLTNTGL